MNGVWWRLAALAIAFWPVWTWYVRRLDDGSDEPLGAFVLAIAAAICVVRRHRFAAPGAAASDGMVVAVVLLYTVSFAFLPNMLRASLAMLAFALMLSRVAFGRTLHVGFTGLLLLSLPIMSSLQFYVGYPLRIASAEVAVAMVRWNGFEVMREGVTLCYGDMRLLVDAPCSGVRMLWVTALVVCLLGCLIRISNARLLGCGLVAMSMVVLGNGLRAASLFFVERYSLPSLISNHDAIGLVCLVCVLLPVVALVRGMADKEASERCELLPS